MFVNHHHSIQVLAIFLVKDGTSLKILGIFLYSFLFILLHICSRVKTKKQKRIIQDKLSVLKLFCLIFLLGYIQLYITIFNAQCAMRNAQLMVRSYASQIKSVCVANSIIANCQLRIANWFSGVASSQAACTLAVHGQHKFREYYSINQLVKKRCTSTTLFPSDYVLCGLAFLAYRLW